MMPGEIWRTFHRFALSTDSSQTRSRDPILRDLALFRACWLSRCGLQREKGPKDRVASMDGDRRAELLTCTELRRAVFGCELTLLSRGNRVLDHRMRSLSRRCCHTTESRFAQTEMCASCERPPPLDDKAAGINDNSPRSINEKIKQVYSQGRRDFDDIAKMIHRSLHLRSHE